METTVKTEKPKKVKTGKKTSKVSDLSKIFGVAKGQIFYDESIFNFGKHKVTI
jgi:hypothetical protein